MNHNKHSRRYTMCCILFILCFSLPNTLLAQYSNYSSSKVYSLYTSNDTLFKLTQNDLKKAEIYLHTFKISNTQDKVYFSFWESDIYTKTNRFEEAQKNIQLILNSNNKNNELDSFKYILNFALAKMYANIGLIDSAIKYINLSNIQIENQAPSLLKLYIGALSAKIYLSKNLSEQSNSYYSQTLQLDSILNTKNTKLTVAKLSAEYYYSQKLYNKAKEINKNCIVQARDLSNKSTEAIALLHLGNIFYLQYEDDSAKRYYEKSLDLYKKIGDATGIATCLSNLSRSYLEFKNYTQAIKYAQAALKTIKKDTYIEIESATYQQLGDIYGELNDFNTAIFYIKKALKLALKSQNKIVILSCYKSLSELYQTTKQYNEAYQYLRKAYIIKDSVQPIIYNKQLAEVEAKFKSAQKEANIKLLEAKQEVNKHKIDTQTQKIYIQRIVITSILIIFIITTILIYLLWSRNQLKEKHERKKLIMEVETSERKRISRDLHDEIGAGLSKIKIISQNSNSKTISNDTKASKSLHLISDISSKMIETMRDLIWTLDTENMKLDKLIARIREYSSEYLEDLEINLQFDLPENIIPLSISKEWSKDLLMIVKETLQNIAKHSSASNVTIKITINPTFILTIIDNGKGINTEPKTNGNGLTNMKHRAKIMKAQLQIMSNSPCGTITIFQDSNICKQEYF